MAGLYGTYPSAVTYPSTVTWPGEWTPAAVYIQPFDRPVPTNASFDPTPAYYRTPKAT